ncbi:MAG TPA: HemK2/MTQ2 family protein methyltransferase [Streptosporangiales bacterium]
MLLLQPPGVYAPQSDTRLLADALRDEALPPGARVLDIGTGTGALALLAARAGAGSVTAVDVSSIAVLTARANAWLHGAKVSVHRGDLFSPVGTGQFQLVLSNPPYVPTAPETGRPGRTDARWDAGRDGRAVVDRLCDEIPDRLAPGGVLLMVHSVVCGHATTMHRLARAGLSVRPVRRARVPFGPVMRSRAAWLRQSGAVGPEQRDEELVVIRAQR